MLHEFHFIRPLWLLTLLPLVLLLWHWARSQVGGNVWRGLVDDHLLPNLLSDETGRVRRLPLVLLGLGWLLGVLALAGPTWERLPQPVYQAQQYRVLALDLSSTMNATDMSPSRLAHARFELQDLLRKTREGQTALLAYGAEPYVVAPLTSDTATIAAQVPSLSTELLPVKGDRRTDLALEKAGELLSQAGAPDGEVILITDGLDHPAAAYDTARKLRREGYRVSVLGVGTAKGAPVSLSGGGFLKDSGGAILMPKLERESLSELASVGAGRFVTAGLGDRDIEALVPSGADRLALQAERQETRSDQWREAGPWLLLALLPLAAVAFRRGWLAPLVLMLLILPPPPAQAFTWQDLWLRPDQQAARDFEAGHQSQAAQRFERPDWRAAAQYASGDYDQALQSLEGVNGPQAAYNKGNTLARLGQLEEALTAYDQALEEDPQNEDAQHNKALVQRLLDQQRQQQQNQQGEQEEQDQQAKQDQQGQSGQSGQQDQTDQRQQAGEQGQQDEQKQSGLSKQQVNQDQQRQHDEQSGQAAAQEKQQQDQRDHQRAEQSKQQEEGQAQAQAAEPKPDQAGQSDRQKQGAQEKPSETTLDSHPENKSAAEPGLADLLGDKNNSTAAASSAAESDLDPEDRQAMEQMLRQVEDDPAGLLRQRFLLQHLRRTGQLP